MVDFQVGDLVKKVRGPHNPGHQGWVKAVFINHQGSWTSNEPTVGLYVTGLPDRGVLPDGRRHNGWEAANWEKVVPTAVDRTRKVLLLADHSNEGEAS